MDAKNDNELMLAVHELFEAIETQRKRSVEDARFLLADIVESVAEEREADAAKTDG